MCKHLKINNEAALPSLFYAFPLRTSAYRFRKQANAIISLPEAYQIQPSSPTLSIRRGRSVPLKRL